MNRLEQPAAWPGSGNTPCYAPPQLCLLSGCGTLLGPGRIGCCPICAPVPTSDRRIRTGVTYAAHPPECPYYPRHTRRDSLCRHSTCAARGTSSGSARSSETSGTVAQRYGISAETVAQVAQARCGRLPRPPCIPFRSHSIRCAAETLGCSAQAANQRPRTTQALPVRRHRPLLAFRSPRGQGRRDRTKRHRLPARGGGRLLPAPPRADRQRQLPHASFRQGLRRPRSAVSAHQAMHAANQWLGRALQRPDRQRGARHRHLPAPCPGADATRSQPSL